MIPGQLPSKEADKLALDMLEGIAREIGTEAFHGVMVKAIETCERRPTIATIRRLAGLNPRMDAQAENLATSWGLVIRVVRKHVGRDSQGNAVLEPYVYFDGDSYREEPVPSIPEGIANAVKALGGWGALAETPPQWLVQRFETFKTLYVGEKGSAGMVKQ